MKKIAFWVAAYFVTMLVQSTFGNLLEIAGIKPDFVLILLVGLSLRYGRLIGSVSGFFMGLGQDAVFSLLFGLNALCKSFAGFLSSLVNWRFSGHKRVDAVIVLFGTALLHDWLFNWIYSIDANTSVWYVLIRYALPGALYTSLIGMLLSLIFQGFLMVWDYESK